MHVLKEKKKKLEKNLFIQNIKTSWKKKAAEEDGDKIMHFLNLSDKENRTIKKFGQQS